jgi:glycosyltransferase involved in cell wall biosynthesis
MARRIFFDGLNLGLRHGTGVATYTRVLVRLSKELGYENGALHATRRRLPRDPVAREIAFFDAPPVNEPPFAVRALVGAGDYLSGVAGVRPRQVPVSGTVITEALGTRWAPTDHVYAAPRVFDQSRGYFSLFKRPLSVTLPLDVDLFHFTYPMPIRTNARANIYTVHDLIPLRLPYTTLDWKSFYLRSMREVLARADHVVTVSENSKRDIMELFGVDERRITNTYQAVHIPERLAGRSDDEIAAQVGGTFGLDHRRYFLFYGSLEPKKNLGRVVESYLAANVDMPLVIITGQSWLGEDEVRLLKEIEKAADGREKRIHRYEYLPFPLLMTLVQGARAVLFPSLYEGFGLPVLEGMSLGTPVITSKVSSVPEVAGDAAIMVDPYSTDEISAAIRALAHDHDLWADMQARGIERAKLFSPEIYREKLRTLYAGLT